MEGPRQPHGDARKNRAVRLGPGANRNHITKVLAKEELSNSLRGVVLEVIADLLHHSDRIGFDAVRL